MSENDEVKPFHAKDVAAGQEAAEAVAAVLKHAHEREEAAKQRSGPKKQPTWMLPLGINLGIFAGYLLVFSPSWVIIIPNAPPPIEARVELTYNEMFLVLSKIESHRIDEGRLPQSLAEVGESPDDFDYTLQGAENYVLLAQVGEETLVYSSARQTVPEWAQERAAGLAGRIGG